MVVIPSGGPARARSRGIAVVSVERCVIPSEAAKRRSRGIAIVPTEGLYRSDRDSSLRARNDNLSVGAVRILALPAAQEDKHF
jgi:hypothetical protein